MYLRKDRRKNGRAYLSIGENYRAGGKTRTRHLESIGYVDELAGDGCPDPIAFWKAEVARRNAEAAAEPAKVIVRLSAAKKIDKRTEGRVEMGAAVPSAYFHRDLGIGQFFERKRTARGFAYDPCRILELLCWNRMSDPGSKKQAFAAKERFPRKCGFSLDDVCRSLDHLDANAEALVKHMNASLEEARGPRDRTRLYYDVTNYYFEIDGEGEEGLRKRGVSKEHRPEAIVQMGLLLDAQGIPLDYELFPGNINDMSTMLPMMEKAGVRDAANPDGERVVVVADKGLDTSTNIAACTLDGNGFVFSQSVRKATGKLRAWVLDETGCAETDSGSFGVKSRIADKAICVTGGDGKKHKVMVPVKEVAFWSRDFCERARRERAKVIEKSKAAIERGDTPAASCKASIKYAKDVPVVKATGEKADHNWVLDEDRIAADAAMDGYYCIITSEQGWSEREVIEAYRGLARIEGSFRVLKGTMDARPVCVWTEPHVRAYFLVCYVALTIVRLMQADVERLTGSRPSAGAVAEALSNMVGHRLDANVHHFDCRTDLTDALCKVIGIDLSREAMTKSQMNKVMSVVKKPRS
ncbi:IS1634 family transposase [Olsenella sp. Marseille-P4559]|uniref:IS1634 family transposase n=1 Tax=Olsenella sp. Marseille-P4559 TaxID=2364795 RepID=UPI001030A998|nr:IS1634 family transposase [Olsenella sp. Marseille-P4559]